MTTNADHERRKSVRAGARARPSFPAIAAYALGGLLLTAHFACKERSNPRSTETGAAQAGAKGRSTAKPPSDPDAVGKRTLRGEMLSHYADSAAMLDALVAGRLGDYQAAAAAVASDEWTPKAAPDANEEAARTRAVARSAAEASSLVAAARALGTLADACASCHVASGAPQPPVAPEQPSEASNARMLAHAVATRRLWAGLTLPSDESWASGIELLLQDPTLADGSPEVSAAARDLLERARQGQRAEPEQRDAVFADILLTCSGCHERLGVVLEDGVVAR